MATTTNYGWTTPDDTALVKDGAAAIRTLGSSVDTTTKNLNPETTLGDIAYRSSTANVKTRLGIGTAGQVLTVAGGVPSWATAAGGGKVLQVVMGSTSTEVSNSTSTFADTTLSASITPSSASSKVLVLFSQQGAGKILQDAENAISIRLVRGATTIADIIQFGAYTATAVRNIISISSAYLDTPSTTSATTYKTQFANNNNAGRVDVQYDAAGNLSTIILMEIGA